MATAALDLGTFLQPGAVYTFSFSPSAGSILDSAFSSDLSGLIGPLQYLSNMANVSVKQASGFSFGLTVTFTYTGDGSDVVASAVQWILDAWTSSQLFGNYDYIGATGGSAPIATGGSDLLTSGISSLVPGSSSSLWALAVIVLLIVFVFSGGAGVTRTLAARVT